MEAIQAVKHSLLTDQYSRFGVVLCVFVAFITWRLFRVDSFYPGFEVFGVDKHSLSLAAAKQNYMRDARNILLDGARKLKGGYQVVTASGPKIILPNRYVGEIKNHKGLSFNDFIKKEFFPGYPGFEAIRTSTKSTVIVDTVRIKLTQSLNPVTIALCEETNLAVDELYGNDKEWKPWQSSKHANNFVARLSTRVFLGEVVCRNESWIKVAVDYTIVMMQAARALRMWPTVTQPFVHWFLPECKTLRSVSSSAKEIISEELARRNQEKAANIDNGTKASKISDSLGWMQELSQGKKIDLVSGQLGLTFAAIHTTSDLVTKCLYYLCAYPEYQDFLRNDIITVLRERGWNKQSLYNMKLLDSFMKETQRLNSLLTINRVAVEKVVLKDGTIIPKGASLNILSDRMFDPSVYPDPERFDGHRFLKLRAQPGQENHWQFVTTSSEHTGFGHGMHACPGRFFASNEIKVALIFLLLRYEWRQDSPKEMPLMFQYGSETIPNPMMEISYRRRQEEVDIMSFLES